jgi:hypothetical protein
MKQKTRRILDPESAGFLESAGASGLGLRGSVPREAAVTTITSSCRVHLALLASTPTLAVNANRHLCRPMNCFVSSLLQRDAPDPRLCILERADYMECIHREGLVSGDCSGWECFGCLAFSFAFASHFDFCCRKNASLKRRSRWRNRASLLLRKEQAVTTKPLLSSPVSVSAPEIVWLLKVISEAVSPSQYLQQGSSP